jgi:hypothetical protein
MTPDAFRRLVALGLSNDQIAGVLEIFSEAEPRRTARQERNARYYLRHKASESKTIKTVKTPIKTPDAFDDFWVMYPNKTGKGDARKAWDKAVKRAEVDALMAGLQRYVNKTDDRKWCNPSTWLNQDRWEDQTVRGGPKNNADLLSEWIDENLSNQGNDNGHEDSRRSHGNVERLSAEQREGFKGRTLDLPPAVRGGRH